MITTIGMPVEIIYYNCLECDAPLHMSRLEWGLCEACEFGWIADVEIAHAAALAEATAMDLDGADVTLLKIAPAPKIAKGRQRVDYPDAWGM